MEIPPFLPAIVGLGALALCFSAYLTRRVARTNRELEAKLASARWGVTCTAVNACHLAELAPDPDRVELVYHGLDFARFPKPGARPDRDGSDPEKPVRLLSVGRAVPKKGYELLLAALAGLPPELHWKLVHIGGGAMLKSLKSKADKAGLSDRVTWRGPQEEETVAALCAVRRQNVDAIRTGHAPPEGTAKPTSGEGQAHAVGNIQAGFVQNLTKRGALVGGDQHLGVECDNLAGLPAGDETVDM